MELALQGLSEFRRDLSKTPAEKLDLLEHERRVRQVVHALGRELMREVFMRADVKEPEVVVNGKRWGNRRESEAPYVTKFGDIPVSRGIYSQAGGGPVVAPMDLRLGIVEKRYTPGVARVLCRAIAAMPADEAAGLLQEAGVAVVSVSTLKRVPKSIAARYETQREEINAELRAIEQVPDEAVTVQVGLDGVMVRKPLTGCLMAGGARSATLLRDAKRFRRRRPCRALDGRAIGPARRRAIGTAGSPSCEE